MNTNYNEIDKNNYNEYIEKILNIYRLSSKDSSILFNIKIENYKCYCSMSIIGRAGDKQEFSDVILDFDDKFFPEFLDVLVTKINNDVRIKVKDIVNLDGDSLVAFRMVTDNNDLFTIDGLSMEDAKHFEKICSDEFKSEAKGVYQINDTHGIGSFKMFLLMISVLVAAFLGIIAIFK